MKHEVYMSHSLMKSDSFANRPFIVFTYNNKNLSLIDFKTLSHGQMNHFSHVTILSIPKSKCNHYSDFEISSVEFENLNEKFARLLNLLTKHFEVPLLLLGYGP